MPSSLRLTSSSHRRRRADCYVEHNKFLKGYEVLSGLPIELQAIHSQIILRLSTSECNTMPRILRKSPVSDRRDQCVAQSQKAVYYWNESRHSDDDVVDIFSTEWTERLKSWHNWLVKTYGPKHVYFSISKLIDSPENLEFKLLFFEHPISTFSLWRVFEAFYALDRTIYGTSSEDLPLEEWRQMKPFQYLESPDVRGRWETELKMLDKRIGCGDLTAEEGKSRMVEILQAVEKLEYSLNLLEQDLGSGEDGNIKYRDWILSRLHNAFEDRCALITEAVKPSSDAYVYDVTSPEAEDSNHDDLDKSR